MKQLRDKVISFCLQRQCWLPLQCACTANAAYRTCLSTDWILAFLWLGLCCCQEDKLFFCLRRNFFQFADFRSWSCQLGCPHTATCYPPKFSMQISNILTANFQATQTEYLCGVMLPWDARCLSLGLNFFSLHIFQQNWFAMAARCVAIPMAQILCQVVQPEGLYKSTK